MTEYISASYLKIEDKWDEIKGSPYFYPHINKTV